MFYSIFALDIVAKATLMLLGVILIDRLLVHRASAALRHRLWSLAFIALLLLPLLSLTVPAWRIAVLPNDWASSSQDDSAPLATAVYEVPLQPLAAAPDGAAEQASPPIATDFADPSPPVGEIPQHVPVATQVPSDVTLPDTSARPRGIEFSWAELALAVWAIGIALALAPLGYGLIRNRGLQSEAVPVHDASLSQTFDDVRARLRICANVRLLESARGIVPMTWGAWNPIVMIPREWRDWPEESRRLVLLHELAHVKRGDVLYQTLARVACAAFWFHPLVWYALRRLRVERELACDDCVLMAGEVPSNYANELLNIARRYQLMVLPPAVAMAQRSGLETRIRSMLDKARSHVPVSPRVARGLLVSSIVAAALLAAIRLEATETNSDSELVGSEPNETDSEAATLVLSGLVVDDEGRPIPNARVIAVRQYRANSNWTRTNEPLGATETDRQGNYQLEVPRRSARFSDGRNLESQATQVIASKKGYGYAHWTSNAPDARDTTLQLNAATHAIDGRIVDLEGNPLPNVQIRVHEIGKAATSVDEWLERALKNPASGRTDNGDPFSAGYGYARVNLAYFPAKYPGIGAIDALGIAPTKTDRNGRFRFPPLGDDQQITLRIDGPGISSTYLQVVTREMPVINMPLDDPRYRSGKVFGKNFTYAVAPEQVIRGQVTDRESGQPLPGVTVSLSQFSDNLLGISGFLTTVTDASGRYELHGVAKAARNSRGVRLEFIPNADQSYFRLERRVRKVDHLSPVDCDIQLTKAIWIEGNLVDTEGAPVRGMVAYYPHLENKSADGHEAFDKGSHSMGYGEGYATDEMGHFRVPGLPGRGALRVVAENAVFYATEGPRMMGMGTQSSEKSWDLYHIMMPGNRMPLLNLSDDAMVHQVNVELSRRATCKIEVVHADGSKAKGYRVGGAFPMGEPTIAGSGYRFQGREAIDASNFEIVLGDVQRQQRPLIVTHAESKTGVVIERVSELAEMQTAKLQLQPYGKIVGRLKNHGDGHLVAGHGKIETIQTRRMNGSGQVTRSAPQKRLVFRLGGELNVEDDGSFELLVPACSKASLYFNGDKESPTLLDQVPIKPGQTFDLGEVDIAELAKSEQNGGEGSVSKAGRNRKRRDSTATAVAEQTSGDKDKSDPATQPTASDKKESPKLRFQGRVLDPAGNPVAEARLHFVYWHRGATSRQMPPVATTNAEGKFDFSVEKSNYENAQGEIWRYMSLFAFKAGFGVGSKRALVFESTNAKYDGSPANYVAVVETLGDDNAIRLVPDDLPIEGRVVTLDGQPVAGANISLKELWRNESESLAQWEKAALSPKADYYSLRSAVSKLSNGPQLPSLIPTATTDANGTFVVRGIGRQRVVELIVSGPDIEATIVKARTGDGDTVTVPHQFGSPASPSPRNETYYPRTFTHVAPPSRPVRGTLTENGTGQPIANVRVSAGSRTMFSSFGKQFITTQSAPTGEYEVQGLALRGDRLYFVPRRGSRYLPQGLRPNFADGEGAAKLDVQFKPMPLIRGRITDDRTGKPIVASVQYFAESANDVLAGQPGFKRCGSHEVITDEEGRYVIAAMPGRGFLAVMAADHTKYKRAGTPVPGAFSSSADAPGMLRTYPSILLVSNFHHVEAVEIEPTENVSKSDQTIDIPLGSGVDFEGDVVDADGKPVTDFVYAGSADTAGWRPAKKNGKLLVQGYYEGRPREILVFHKATNSTARIALRGKPPKKLTIELEPAATIRGRLLDEQGLPLRNKKIRGDGVVQNHFGDPSYAWATDDEGRFEVPGILPGRPYTLSVASAKGLTEFVNDVSVAKPNVKDLGEITVK